MLEVRMKPVHGKGLSLLCRKQTSAVVFVLNSKDVSFNPQKEGDVFCDGQMSRHREIWSQPWNKRFVKEGNKARKVGLSQDSGHLDRGAWPL